MSGEGKELFMIQIIPHHVMTWTCMTANGTVSLLCIGDVTAERSIGMNYEVYSAIQSTHSQPNATMSMRSRFQSSTADDFHPSLKNYSYIYIFVGLSKHFWAQENG